MLKFRYMVGETLVIKIVTVIKWPKLDSVGRTANRKVKFCAQTAIKPPSGMPFKEKLDRKSVV